MTCVAPPDVAGGMGTLVRAAGVRTLVLIIEDLPKNISR
jgi:hypothetical protein